MPQATVGSELRRLFPDGTSPVADDTPGSLRWDELPPLPVDVFAAVAHLLDASGAYQYIVAPFVSMAGQCLYDNPTITPRAADIAQWTDIGRKWAQNILVGPRWVAPTWAKLWACETSPLVEMPTRLNPPPKWWAIAHQLLVIADEASADIGYVSMDAAARSREWANKLAARRYRSRMISTTIPGPVPGDDSHKRSHVALDSIAISRAREVARLAPKGRTTEIGCNMRTLSHNLALLPPRGRADIYWHMPLYDSAPAKPDVLNLLLVPFPFVIPDGCFYGEEAAVGPGEPRWGRFRIRQKWLSKGRADRSDETSRQAIVAFIECLLRKAEANGAPANGILLPEYALDWETYDLLVRHLSVNRPEVEFLISGASKDCSGHAGNFVISTYFGDVPRQAWTHSRQKHHRWRIDADQIEGYAIAELDPKVLWWEHLAIEQRILHVDVFRSRSTFTAVICEDLARVEPILSVLRALGPNLVFALLMDGAQVKARWPGTYATSLADDPGSSILSMTSLGLIRRSMKVRAARKQDCAPIIALWKNRPVGGQKPEDAYVELDVEDGHALIIELAAQGANETTLDGRRNIDATAWSFEKRHKPLSVDAATLDANDWRWIVEG